MGKLVVMIVSMVVLAPSAGWAQSGGQGLAGKNPEERACEWIRLAGNRGLRYHKTAAKYGAKAACRDLERSCLAALKGRHPKGCTGAQEKACDEDKRACDLGYRDCKNIRGLRAIQKRIVAEKILFQCVELQAANCPLKNIQKVNEPALCTKAQAALDEVEDADVGGAFGGVGDLFD